jgi:hypothetical protein
VASKRRKNRGRICRGKHDYGDDLDRAKYHARHLSCRDEGTRVDVFQCPTCDGTHVGHAPWDHTGKGRVIARFERGKQIL